MKLYFMKVGYFLIFIFAILNFLGLKQTEFEIRQLDSTARILTTHAEAIQAAQEQPTLNAAAAAALTRADTQIAIASFSNENVAGEAKRLASLCNANIKEKSITASVSNDAVLEEMARRPNMYGRLVIPSVGVNVALFAVVSQAAADAQDSAAYFPFKNYMLVADHWNQGFWKIKRCSVGTKAYIYRGTSIQTLTKRRPGKPTISIVGGVKCTGICCGVNAGYDLLYEDGSSATTGSGTIMYTCNGSNYHDITLTFWS